MTSETTIRRQGLAVYRMLLSLQVLMIAVGAAGLAVSNVPHVFAAILAVAAVALVLILNARRRLAARFLDGDAAQEKLIRTSSRDSLTGALSRHAFLEALESSVHHGSRSAVTLLLVDVDHFKSINDSHGHGVGDAVLRHLVDVASGVFPDGSVSRLGGDEFAVLLKGESAEAGQASAALFLARLAVPTTIAGRQVRLGASIGLATSPRHSVFSDELMLCADLALYESKRRGRGTATVFDDAMMADQKYGRLVERELRAALLLDELELHYQPMTNARGEIGGVEALVRWRHPVRGLMAPDRFIAIAEQSTLIDRVGEWVFRRACRDARSLPGTRIGINVSAAQIQRDAFVEMVAAVLGETGCPAGRFVFEITESVALSTSRTVLQRLKALQDMGARIAIDDFGTGHFGFSSLRALPIDCIKVDRTFIQSLESDEIAVILVTALGAIGRAKGIVIVAEGIETEAQLVLAKAAGCSGFQGYWLGRPVPLEDLVRMAPTVAA